MRLTVWLGIAVLSASSCAAADLQQLLRAHQERPGDWKIAHETALAYTERNQFSEAAAFYRKALAANPGFLPAQKNLAVVLWFAGRHAESERLFRQLIARIPNDPVPHLYLGLADHNGNRHADAHRHFAAAGALALENPDVLPEVVGSYLAVKDKSVLAVAAAQLAAARDVQLSLRTAAAMDRFGAAEAAWSTYREALAFAPAHEPLYIAFASFASAHQNNPYGIEILDLGLKHLPGSAKLRFQRGLLTALQGDRARAMQDLQAAAGADAGWTLPVLAMGVLQLEDGRPSEAAATFEAAARRQPSDLHAAYLRALALSRTGDDGTRAEQIDLLQRVLRTEPGHARSLLLLGQIYAVAGRTTEAVAQLKKAIAADQRSATAHYQLSLALRRAGQTGEANRHMERFRALRDAASAKQDSELVQFLRVVR
jgi:tetratricopeptide (TPR) repeat protein